MVRALSRMTTLPTAAPRLPPTARATAPNGAKKIGRRIESVPGDASAAGVPVSGGCANEKGPGRIIRPGPIANNDRFRRAGLAAAARTR
jgi:hypothetical protein